MSLPPWLDDAWRTLAARLEAGRLPHAILIAGPAGLGKRELAEALAAAALCTQRRPDGHACGVCRACLLTAAGSHPDRVRITFGIRDDGKPRSEIVVDQIRALSERLSLASQFGGLQVATIEPADAMNASAANALLKTLEEPSASTVIVLVSDLPARLAPTIRSRCQRIVVAHPSREQALAWLSERGLAADRAQAALDASLGNPGRALVWSEDSTVELRAACARDLAALASGRASAQTIATSWVEDRPAERLWFAAVLAEDEARKLARGERGALGLTAVDEIPKLAAWFARANRARELLSTPLRAELVMLDVLLGWPAARRG